MNSFSSVHAKYCMWLLAIVLWMNAGAAFSQSYNDISLKATASQTVATTGDTVIFTVQVFNEGKTSLTGLSVHNNLPAGATYLSHSAAPGTSFDPATGMWAIGSSMTADVQFLTLGIEIQITGTGLILWDAQVWAMNEFDVDSAPANHFILEDDHATASVSVPISICTALGESVTLKAPPGYTGYEWFRDNGSGPVWVGDGDEYVADQPGLYSFSVYSNSCPVGMSCPVIIEECFMVNEPPVANLDTASTPPNTPVIIDVLANDEDPEDGLDPASVTITDPPANGAVTVHPDGSVTYTPNLDFFGLDTFIYQVCDSGVPVLCDTALVIVTVGDLFFDLALTKTLAPGQPQQVNIGDEIVYHLTVINEGYFAATNIEITDYIPAGLAFGPDNPGWTLNPDGHAIFLLAGPLQPGATETVELILQVVYGASGQVIPNIAELTAAADINGNVIDDIDSEPNNNDVDEDDQDMQLIELIPHDPTGYIYCDKTGKIITGGTISVTGPGQVFIIRDGFDGYYEFFTDGTPGLYTLSYHHPDGYPMSTTCLPQPGALDPTGLPDPFVLGQDTTGMMLTDFSCGANPYYLLFDIEPGDPFVNNNNLPLQCVYIGSIVCLDPDGSGQNTSGAPGVAVNLYDCSDTLNPIMTTLTDADGQYAFDGLLAGNYMLQFVLPGGYRFIENNIVSVDGFSDCITLDFGECDTTTSVCIYWCPQVEAGQDVEICAGEPVQLQASMPYGTGSFSWLPAIGLSENNIADPIASPAQTTTYFVTFDDGLGCVSTDSVTVTVIGNCPVDTVILNVNCDLSDPLFCFDVPYDQLPNYQFELDGNPYTAEFGPCSLVRDRYYTYVSILGFGTTGPYRLEYWNVNGVVHTADFQTINDLVVLMNQWDVNGHWTHDPDARSFAGGHPHSFYGKMIIRHLGTGSIAELDLNELYSIDRTYVKVPEGEHTLVITNTVTGETNTVHLRVNCISPDYVEITQPVGSADTICLSTDELQGNVAAIFNPCLDGFTNASDLNVIPGTNCVEAFGLFPGQTEACYVICDDMGVCDTTYIQVTVFSLDLVLNPDSLCTPKEVAITGEILGNDVIPAPVVSLTIVNQPQHGTVTVNPDHTVTYIPDNGYCSDGGPFDQFTYQVCTATQCQTTVVYVQVKCDGIVVYNGFSPNGDGVNDFFKIDGLGDFPDHKIMVFNRWGNRVFETKNYRNDWDGWWFDKKLPVGTYFYLIDLGDGSDWLSGYLQIIW